MLLDVQRRRVELLGAQAGMTAPVKTRVRQLWTWRRFWRVVRETSVQILLLTSPFYLLGLIALLWAWLRK